MKTFTLYAVPLALALLIIPAHADKGGAQGTRLKAKLTGPAVAGVTPSGEAQFKTNTTMTRSELDVEVEHVAAGATLDVQLNGTSIGSITAGKTGESELELETEQGGIVPAVKTGDTISVLNAGVVILTGVF